MHYKTCEICGIRAGRVLDHKRTFMAKFPMDKDRCKQWVKVTGKEDLAYVPIEKLHTLKFVCGKHFRPKDFNKNKTQLKKNAVPSLHITAEPLRDEILIEFPLPIAKDWENQDRPQWLHNGRTHQKNNAESPLLNTNSGENLCDSHITDTDVIEEHITDSHTYAEVVVPVCQICLRTDFEYVETDSALVDFYDELVYYEMTVPVPQFCPLCQHFLKKCYNFRQKCRRAHIVLHEWMTSDPKDRRYFESLQSVLPPSKTLGVCTLDANLKIFDCESTSPEEETAAPSQVKIGEDAVPDVTSYIEGFLDTNDGCEMDFAENNENNNEVAITPNVAEKTEPKLGRRENYAQRQVKRVKSNFKESVLLRMNRGEFTDIEDQGTILTKEIFLDIVDKAPIMGMKKAIGNTDRIRLVLVRLLRRYNPVYESMFETEYLDTDYKALAEFNIRKDTKLYLDATFKCVLCYKVFESQAYLDYHSQWHDPEKQFVCNICPMRFDTEQKMVAHKSKFHYVVHRCKLCHYYSSVRSVMKHHYKEHLNGKGKEYLRGRSRSGIPKPVAEFTCDACGKLFQSADILHKHEIAMHKEREFVCTLCGRDFASQGGLQSHIRLKHHDSSEELSTTPTEQCEQCAASFHRQEALHKHVLIFHTLIETDTFKCSCGAVLSNDEELNSHRSSKKHKLKPQTDLYKICAVCDEILPSAILYQHFKSSHPSESYTYSGTRILCELCGKSFKVRAHYVDHLNAHAGITPYECSECGARFALRKHAAQHIARHGEPNYRCTHCDKLFHTKRARYAHEKIHSREGRQHSCKICHAAFVSALALSSHIDWVHSNMNRNRKSSTSRTRVFKNKITNAFAKLRQDDAAS